MTSSNLWWFLKHHLETDVQSPDQPMNEHAGSVLLFRGLWDAGSYGQAPTWGERVAVTEVAVEHCG